jgi:ribosomal protein S4E
MDTTTADREIVKQVIGQYARFIPSHGDIRLDTVFDDEQGHYALMQVGWDRGRRVRGNLIYITLHDGQVWIEYDGMEQGITQDLVKGGIAPERIKLAFAPEVEVVGMTQ